MTVLDHAQKRVDAVIEEVDRLKQSDFPYDHSRDALELLGEKLVHLRNVLKKINPAGSSESILPHCITSLDALFNCVSTPWLYPSLYQYTKRIRSIRTPHAISTKNPRE